MATSREIPTEVTQMVTRGNQHTRPTHSPQGSEGPISEANKIGASTPYDFEGKNLTAYGGLLPVATMLEKLEFQRVVEETLTVKRVTRVMSLYQFVLAMVLALYVGFSRLHHLRFLAETREYLMGELHNGDRPSGAQIARHLERASAALPKGVERVYARADSGFYCCEAVEAYERRGWQFIISARKTARLVDELKAAKWKPSPRTDADGQCEFRYQPEGWCQA